MDKMSFLGNLLWFISCGLLTGLSWFIAGCFWCITIIGIPLGYQCFKFAKLSFFPFGKEVVYGGGAGKFFLNILWILITGIPMTIEYLCIGLVCYITIIGIPFGKQCFKLAKLTLMPFGSSII